MSRVPFVDVELVRAPDAPLGPVVEVVIVPAAGARPTAIAEARTLAWYAADCPPVLLEAVHVVPVIDAVKIVDGDR